MLVEDFALAEGVADDDRDGDTDDEAERAADAERSERVTDPLRLGDGDAVALRDGDSDAVTDDVRHGLVESEGDGETLGDSELLRVARRVCVPLPPVSDGVWDSVWQSLTEGDPEELGEVELDGLSEADLVT